MADLLVDTDVYIDHLRGHRVFAPVRNRVHYSVVTRAELFAGRNTDEEAIRILLGPFTEIMVDRLIAERAGQLRRNHQVAMADAIIAATALERDLILMTRNKSDFDRVDSLRIRVPV